MPHVLAVGLDESLAAEVSGRSGVDVRPVALDGIVPALDPAETLAVVAAAPNGVLLAQTVHAAAPGIAVLLVGDEASCGQLQQVLAITPRIGRHTRCLGGDRAMLADAVAEEVGWARRRAEHRRTMSTVRSTIGQLTALPPETTFRALGRLFDHAPIGILVADAEGMIQAANPRSETVLGRQPRDAAGSSFSSLFSGENEKLARDLVVDCATTGEVAVTTLVRTGPEGTVQHVEVTVAAVDPEHVELGVIILLHDESARIHALHAAQRARESAELSAAQFADMARTLQRSLLPPDLPDIPDMDLAARYHAAGDGTIVGGDFYDAFCFSDGRWCIVLGDVSGKGVEAAALTALARHTLRTAAMFAESLAEMVGTLNRMLLDQPANESFCTLAAVLLDPDGGAEVGIAGHPAPTVVRRRGDLESIGRPSPPVGLFDDLRLTSSTTVLAPGDAMVITSDGVTEARSPTGAFVPDLLDRVLPHVAGQGAPAIADAVDAGLLAVERVRSRDDVAIMVIARRP